MRIGPCVLIFKCSCILYIATNCNIVVFMTVCIYIYRYIHTTELCYSETNICHRSAQNSCYISVTKTNRLMVFSETIDVYCKNDSKTRIWVGGGSRCSDVDMGFKFRGSVLYKFLQLDGFKFRGSVLYKFLLLDGTRSPPPRW